MGSIGIMEKKMETNVGPCLMIGGPPPPEQLVFLFNPAAPPKFAAQLNHMGPENLSK